MTNKVKSADLVSRLRFIVSSRAWKLASSMITDKCSICDHASFVLLSWFGFFFLHPKVRALRSHLNLFARGLRARSYGLVDLVCSLLTEEKLVKYVRLFKTESIFTLELYFSCFHSESHRLSHVRIIPEFVESFCNCIERPSDIVFFSVHTSKEKKKKKWKISLYHHRCLALTAKPFFWVLNKLHVTQGLCIF